MTDTPNPLLVYDRIDANRRTTRLLLAFLAVPLLPLVSGGAAFIFPLIHLMYAVVMSTHLAAAGPTSRLWPYAGLFLVSIAIAGLVIVAVTDVLISRYGLGFVLRQARARPVDSSEEPELVQIVEHLCLGAGLRPPRIHVIEAVAPNAFATGLSPADASLVVTRGLLQLLDRRQLEGVIAHQLSHIGNHDITLTTTLAALIGALSIPLKMLSAPLRFAFRLSWKLGAVVMGCAFVALFSEDSLLMTWWILADLIDTMQYYLPGAPYGWWHRYALFVPLYTVFGAPLLALLIRQAVSQQRQLLADADAALITRDPEGLALALVAIDAVRAEPLQVEESTVHLYFVDPQSTSWLHVLIPSHPSVEHRIDLLARMGSGIAPSAIQAARDAGARFESRESELKKVQAPSPDSPHDDTASSAQTPDLSGFDGFTRLYDQPADGSRLLALLTEDTVVCLEGREGDFVRVRTEDGMEGYVFQPTGSLGLQR